MRRFELCFELGEGAKRWLIPGLLTRERPIFDWQDTDAVRFEYRYALLPSSIMSRFIVRIHERLRSDHPVYWRNGVMLEIDGAQALVEADSIDKRIMITVRGSTAALRRAVLTAVRMQLDLIHASMPGIQATGRVPLPDRPNATVAYDHLLLLEEKGVLTFWPEGADREYGVEELLAGVGRQISGKYNKRLKALDARIEALRKENQRIAVTRREGRRTRSRANRQTGKEGA
jgi:internalin A